MVVVAALHLRGASAGSFGRNMKPITIDRIGYGLAAFPMLVLADLLAYAIRVGVSVGHWPTYGNPESWSVGYPLHYAMLRPWFHVFPIVLFPLLTLAYGVVAWLAFRRFPTRLFATLGITTVVLLVFIHFDPGNILDWFLD